MSSRSNNNAAQIWASHLRQYIERNVIHPHVTAAGDVLGARAIPCAAGPLMGVALAISDNRSFLRESASAVLKAVSTTQNNGPARYAAWCLLDCCARLVAHRSFRDELLRALPSLVATAMPLSGVAEPTIIDVDDDETVDATRVKARLERKCFRRLYLELLDGWIREPWWTNPPAQLVEHVVLALCGGGTQQQGHSGRSRVSAASSFGVDSHQQQQQQMRGNPAMLSAETFVKLEPGTAGKDGAASASSSSSFQMAAVKAEAGLPQQQQPAAQQLSASTLSKVLDVIFTTKKQQEEKLRAAATAAVAQRQQQQPMSGSGKHLQELLMHQKLRATQRQEDQQNAAAVAAATSNNSATSASAALATDLYQEKRLLVNSINGKLRSAGTTPTGAATLGGLFPSQQKQHEAVRCHHCGSLFASLHAKNAHTRIHFPRVEGGAPGAPGQKLSLMKLPPPNPQEFIHYISDAVVAGAPALSYATDVEYTELQRAAAKVQAQQHSSGANVVGAGASAAAGGTSSSSSSSSTSAVQNTVPKYGRFSTGGANVLLAFAAGTLSSKVGKSSSSATNTADAWFGNASAASASGGGGAGGSAAATNNLVATADGVVLVKDPLTKRSCFKCTKAFTAAPHTASGAYYLVDCIEVARPDGGRSLAHRECVF